MHFRDSFAKYILVLIVCYGFCSCSINAAKPRKEDSQRAITYVDQGIVALQAGAYVEARAAFSMALELAPLAAALDGLGCVAYMQKDLATAEDFFVRATTLDPTYSPAFANLALLHEETDRGASAERLYQRALDLDPQNYRARNNYAGLLLRYGERSLASKEILKAQAVKEDGIIVKNIVTIERENYEKRN